MVCLTRPLLMDTWVSMLLCLPHHDESLCMHNVLFLKGKFAEVGFYSMCWGRQEQICILKAPSGCCINRLGGYVEVSETQGGTSGVQSVPNRRWELSW